jgi:pimeloyl-ACP methyl ester carboxylesterase
MSSDAGPGPISETENRRNEMTVAEMTTSADGTAIAFDRIGSGPALILIGGAFNDRRTPAALAEELASEFTVYTYDRRGRGDSGDTQPYAVEREVEDLESVIGAAGGSARLYGHSSGAELARATAARGISVPKLAMYEPPYFVDDSRPASRPDLIPQLEGLVGDGLRGDAVELWMREGPMKGMPPEALDGMLAEMRAAPMWQGLEALAHTLPYDTRVMAPTQARGPLPTEWTDSVTLPTLVMDGGESPPWQRNACRALVELLPDATYRTLEGQDHRAEPSAVAPVLEAFLA